MHSVITMCHYDDGGAAADDDYDNNDDTHAYAYGRVCDLLRGQLPCMISCTLPRDTMYDAMYDAM